MNPRIRELAEQARLIPVGQPDGTSPYMEGLNRFAQLIIKECCNQLHDPNKHSNNDFAKWRIHQHFGVEE